MPLKSLGIFPYMLLQNSASLLSHPLHCQNSSNQTFKPFQSGIKIKVICKQLPAIHFSSLLPSLIQCLSAQTSSFRTAPVYSPSTPEHYLHTAFSKPIVTALSHLKSFLNPPGSFGMNHNLTVARRAEYQDHRYLLVKCFHIVLDLILQLMSPQTICLICVCLFVASRL